MFKDLAFLVERACYSTWGHLSLCTRTCMQWEVVGVAYTTNNAQLMRVFM